MFMEVPVRVTTYFPESDKIRVDAPLLGLLGTAGYGPPRPIVVYDKSPTVERGAEME